MNRLRPATSCFTAAWIQPFAASRTSSDGSAASAAAARIRERAAGRCIAIHLRHSEFLDEVSLSADVGEAEIPAEIRISKLRVVEPQQRQDARVQVVEVNLVADCAQTEFVG